MDRLKKRADFIAAAQGPRIARPAFIVQARLRDDPGPCRIGFTVTKKVGTATERNRVRRRLREVVRHAGIAPTPLSRDYVIVGRRSALDRDFTALIDDFRFAMKRLSQPPAGRTNRSPGSDSTSTAPSSTESLSSTKSSATTSRAGRTRKTGPQRPDR